MKQHALPHTVPQPREFPRTTLETTLQTNPNPTYVSPSAEEHLIEEGALTLTQEVTGFLKALQAFTAQTSAPNMFTNVATGATAKEARGYLQKAGSAVCVSDASDDDSTSNASSTFENSTSDEPVLCKPIAGITKPKSNAGRKTCKKLDKAVAFKHANPGATYSECLLAGKEVGGWMWYISEQL